MAVSQSGHRFSELCVCTPRCLLRTWRPSDAVDLSSIGDSRRIWRNLTHQFPFPFTIEVAVDWIDRVRRVIAGVHFAICYDEHVVGAIGANFGEGIFSGTAEFGYWLGEKWWGGGIATEVSYAFTRFLMREFSIRRIQAYVFDWNNPSMRVLEKCGFLREARLSESAFKDGKVVDEHLFALTSQRRYFFDYSLFTKKDSQLA